VQLHPLAKLYHKAREAYEAAERRLAIIEAELDRIEEELAKLQAKLTRLYGPGYLTVKSVRNRQGRRYRYPVWRTLEGRDIYLGGEEAEEALELRRRLRELRMQYNRYRRVLWAAKLYMKTVEEYKDVCITESGEYVTCPRAGRQG
jgi:DNA repair exonuclease SbcCD ATPase subunit